MKINIDFNLKEKNNPEKFSNQQIFLNWFNFGLGKKYPDGVKGQLLRSVNRVVRKIEDAVDTDKSDIELEETEKDIMKSAFSDDTTFPVYAVSIISLIQDEVQKLTS